MDDRRRAAREFVNIIYEKYDEPPAWAETHAESIVGLWGLESWCDLSDHQIDYLAAGGSLLGSASAATERGGRTCVDLVVSTHIAVAPGAESAEGP